MSDVPAMPQNDGTVLGVEGGGTKTDWMLFDREGRVLREGQLHAANLKLISDAELARLFGVLPRAEKAGVFLAGCLTAGDRARLRQLAEAAWPGTQIAVGSDRESGFATALGDGDGIVVISGTGAVVHGRRGGRVEKAGGWGHILGDRGGGYDLARHALRKILLRHDLEGHLPEIGKSILAFLGLNELPQLVEWIHNASKMDVARLAPVIFRAAESDGEMLALIRHRARDLAEFTHAVARRLGLAQPRVRLLGGLLTKEPLYSAIYSELLEPMLPRADVDICAESGARGAAMLAGGAQPHPAPAVAMEQGGRAELAAATTEQPHPRAAELGKMNTAELVSLFVDDEGSVRAALAACAAPLAAAVETITAALAASGRLFYIGAGTSGRLGVLDASEIPPTFGTPPDVVQGIIAGGTAALTRAAETAEDSPEAGALALLERGVSAGDVVCGITASGRTPFVLGALARARELGARTVFITCNPTRRRAVAWDVEIDLPTGPEIVAGSTRLKAGTATKVALNILTTCTMIRLGRVRDGAMLDLRATNAKLRERATRIVSVTLGIAEDEARERLAAADWRVRAVLNS